MKINCTCYGCEFAGGCKNCSCHDCDDCGKHTTEWAVYEVDADLDGDRYVDQTTKLCHACKAERDMDALEEQALASIEKFKAHMATCLPRPE